MENNEPKWYVIHTYSGYEGMVEDNLRNMVENNNLQEFITDVKVPIEEKMEERNGKRKIVERKKFPSYVFIKMIYTNHIWFMVTSTRGVTGFVGPAGRPLPLTQDEVKRMGLEVVDIEDFNINVGDTVQVISGPLEGTLGTVEDINAEKQTVKVIVSMFGRENHVQLEFKQVEKV